MFQEKAKRRLVKPHLGNSSGAMIPVSKEPCCSVTRQHHLLDALIKHNLLKAFTNVTNVKRVMTKAKEIIVLILMSVILLDVMIMMRVWNYYVPILKVWNH